MFLCAVLFVQAQQGKIAVIDMAEVFNGYEKTKLGELKLKQQAEVFQEYSANLTTQLEKLRKELGDLVNAAQNMALTEAERQNKMMSAQDKNLEIQNREKELRDYQREKQFQMREAHEAMRTEILKEINVVVSNKATLGGYILVLDKSGMTTNQIAAVVYHAPGMDITESVLADLNRGMRAAPKAEDVKARVKDNEADVLTKTEKEGE